MIRANSRALQWRRGHHATGAVGQQKRQARQWQRDCGVRGYRMINPSVWGQQQAANTWSLSHIALPPADCRMLVHGLHFTFTPPHCHKGKTCINKLLASPSSCCRLQCTLQHAVIWFLGPRLTLWKFRVWVRGGGGGWPPLSQCRALVEFSLPWCQGRPEEACLAAVCLLDAGTLGRQDSVGCHSGRRQLPCAHWRREKRIAFNAGMDSMVKTKRPTLFE